MRRVFVVAAIFLALTSALPVRANEGSRIVIETSKPLGPSPGIFSLSASFVDAGTFFTTRRVTSARGAPDFLVTHVVIEFVGAFGTLTVHAQIKETVTADP